MVMANIKISGFYDEVSSNLDEQIKLIKEYGESYLCPRVVDGKNIANYTEQEFRSTVKPRLDNAGIKFSSIGSPIGKIGLYDDEAYEAQLAKLKELVKICKDMDLQVYQNVLLQSKSERRLQGVFPRGSQEAARIPQGRRGYGRDTPARERKENLRRHSREMSRAVQGDKPSAVQARVRRVQLHTVRRSRIARPRKWKSPSVSVSATTKR